MDIINSKKKKGVPMPYQCEICGNCSAVRKNLRDMDNCENNKCYEERTWYHNNEKRIDMYAPFTNSVKKIELTCRNFSHMRTLKCK